MTDIPQSSPNGISPTIRLGRARFHVIIAALRLARIAEQDQELLRGRISTGCLTRKLRRCNFWPQSIVWSRRTLPPMHMKSPHRANGRGHAQHR
jgi:hypothetical protein